jgi:hypothetical protein
MKLRIKGNSMRFRVSRSEVARLLAADPLDGLQTGHAHVTV